MKKLLALIVLTGLCCASGAAADVSKSTCKNDARKVLRDAVSSANEDYTNAIQSCQNPCLESCGASWKSCVEPYRSTRHQCVQSAEDVFKAAVESCKTSTGCTNRCFTNRNFQACLVDPRVARRTTINTCFSTEAQGVRGAGCSSALRICRNACKSSGGSNSSSSSSSSSSESSSSSSEGH